jgi:hypothetical protein
MPTSILSKMRWCISLDDAGGLAHVVDLGVALDRALPVDQPGRIDEAGIRQMLLQRGEGGRREPVIVHLDADRQLVPAALGDSWPGSPSGDARSTAHSDRVADDVVMLR